MHVVVQTRDTRMPEKLIYSSSNGDIWVLIADDSRVFVEHRPNASSGGRVSRRALADFFRERPAPQQVACEEIIAAALLLSLSEFGESHPAGPHAADHLTDHNRTPGAGSLPAPKEGDVDPGVG